MPHPPPPPPPRLVLPFQRKPKKQLIRHLNDSASTVTITSFTTAATKSHFTEDTDSDYIPIRHRRGSEPTRPLTRSNSAPSKSLSPLVRFWQWSKRRDESVPTLIGGNRVWRPINPISTIDEKVDTAPRLRALRVQMAKEGIDYFIIPSEDGHLSEYPAPSERRREWISGFSGASGTAIISKHSAYLFTDSPYWDQAQRELDSNWSLQKVGWQGTRDWLKWVIFCPRGSRIGIDSRMIGHERAICLLKGLYDRGSKLVHPRQNLVDLVWEDQPKRSKDAVYIQPEEYASKGAQEKLGDIREWIRSHNVAVEQAEESDSSDSPTTATSTTAASTSEGSTDTASITAQYSNSVYDYGTTPPPTPSRDENITAVFVSSLPGVAHMLNLRGSDDPVFTAYLLVTLDKAVLFIDPEKISAEVRKYLDECGVSLQGYRDVWAYLRYKEWGNGKIIINPNTPYGASLIIGSKSFHVSHSNPESFRPPIAESVRSIHPPEGDPVVSVSHPYHDTLSSLLSSPI